MATKNQNASELSKFSSIQLKMIGIHVFLPAGVHYLIVFADGRAVDLANMSTSMSWEQKSVGGLMGELPYLSSPHEGYLNGEVCYNCFQTDAPNDVICSACKQMYYCSTTCQQEDWTYGPHERECRVYSRISADLMQQLKEDGVNSVQCDVRMVGRMMVKRQQDAETEPNSESGFPQGFSRKRVGELLTHVQNIPQSWVQKKWSLFNSTYVKQDNFFKNVTYEQYKAYIGVISINSFGICKSNMYREDRSIGKGLYLQFSRFNHACGDPDFNYFCVGRALFMRPLKPHLQITKDTLDSFLIDYGTRGACGSTKDRQTKLQGGYFFLCQCQMCRDDVADVVKSRAVQKDCSHCRKPLIARKRKTILGQLQAGYYYCLYCKKEDGQMPFEHYKRYRKLLTKIISTVDSDDFTADQMYTVLEEADNLPLKLHDIANLPLYKLRQRFCRRFVLICKEGIYVSDENIDRILITMDKVLKAKDYYKFTGLRWNSILAAKVASVCQDRGRPLAAIRLYEMSRDMWSTTTTPDYYIVKQLEAQIADLQIKTRAAASEGYFNDRTQTDQESISTSAFELNAPPLEAA